MTTPFWCLLITAIFPFVLAGVGGYLRVKQLGSLDVKHPRVQALELRDAAARAYAAQQNAWEALSVFGVAVIVAHIAGANPGTSATVASVFVLARVLHAVFYIANLAPLRTLSFVVGLVCSFTLFGLAAQAA